MKRCLKYVASILLLSAMTMGSQPMQAAPKGWEAVRSERTDAKLMAKDTEIEIKAANGVIIVSTNHPASIKVFTILGRLVSSDSLPAGKSQLQLPVHGVYIVKVGDLTCKVAI